MKKGFIAVLYLVLIFLGFVYKEALTTWLQHGGDISDIPYIVLLATLLALVPVIPFGVIAGIVGVKYGVWLGGLMNVVSSTAAAMIMFMAVRYVFSDRGRAYLLRQKTIHRFTVLIEKNAFLSVLVGRLIPIVPSVAINIYAALCNIPFMLFLSATVLGKIPVMLVFAFVGEQAFHNAKSSVYALAIYAACLLLGYIGYRYVLARKI